MSTKVRALVWEEFRVGGAIAALCSVMGVLFLVECRWVLGAEAWVNGEEWLAIASIAGPIAIGLLLVLNPNNSGHLEGGYARRILWMPVPTPLAVAVPLCVRSLLVLTVAFVMLGVTRGLFEGGPSLALALGFLMMYLIAQVFDWLRAPVSGLSSLAGLCIFLGLVYSLAYVRVHEIQQVFSLAEVAWFPAIIVALLAIPVAYAMSVAAVYATRVGRRVGVPEIWEWPDRISLPWEGRIRAFSSPVAAQIWFGLRRRGWVYPVSAVGIGLLMYIPLWVLGRNTAGMLVVFIPYIALVVAAFPHAAVTYVSGFGTPMGKAGFEYLRPMSTADYALAKVLTNAIVLIPALALAAALHFWTTGTVFRTEVIPFAWGSGMTDAREFAWIFLGRCFVVGMIAWVVMSAGTRCVSTLLLVDVLVSLVDNAATLMIGETKNVFANAADWILLATTTTWSFAVFAYAMKKRLLTWHHAATCGLVWLLCAWLIRAAFPWPSTVMGLVTQSVICLGVGALMPLPYVSFLIDIARQRHSTVPVQDSISGAQPDGKAIPYSRGIVALGAAAAVWLGWPAEPAYWDYFRAQGIPVTAEELNASYPEVPENQNVALDYLAISRRLDALQAQFLGLDLPESGGDASLRRIQFSADTHILIVGDTEMPGSGPIPDDVWGATETYWTRVTSKIAPALVELGAKGGDPSRYPIDPSENGEFNMSHLGKLSALRSELELDVAFRSITGESGKAVESAMSLLPLCASLVREPLRYSAGQVRNSLASGFVDSVGVLMTRANLTDAQLARLNDALDKILPPYAGGKEIGEALLSEYVLYFDNYKNTIWLDDSEDDGAKDIVRPIQIAALPFVPSNGDFLSAVYPIVQSMDIAEKISPVRRARLENLEEKFDASMSIFSILSSIYLPRIENEYVREWHVRMKLGMARSAIAVERFRRANGRFPARLADLVPAYLDAVPLDIYAPTESFVQMTTRDDGSFLIYSIGRNGRDDGGMEHSPENRGSDDIAFEVAARN